LRSYEGEELDLLNTELSVIPADLKEPDGIKGQLLIQGRLFVEAAQTDLTSIHIALCPGNFAQSSGGS
jgi:hypothetical protein